jgi:F-type H+-transporting ATPase subunit alpha
VAAIYSGTGGYLDRIKVDRVREFQQGLIERLHSEESELMEKIGEGDWDDGIESKLGDAISEAIDDFGADFDEEGNPLEEGESDRVKSEEEREKPGRTSGEGSDEEESSDDEDEEEGSEEEEKEEAGATA